MSGVGYFIVYIAIAIWVFRDSKTRRINGLPWAVCTAILGPTVVPVYLAKRPLKDGEVREGGMAWNILKNFALFWTLTMLAVGVAGMFNAADAASDAHSDAEKVGAGCGIVAGIGMLIAMWFIPMICALMLGFFLKKSSIVEKGPTGSLA